VKRTLFLFATLLVFGCASKPQIGPNGLPDKPFDLPDPSAPVTTRSISEIARAVDQLRPIIGRYPPVFRDAAQRDAIYEQWSETVLSAEALDPQEAEETRLSLLAELYRQGHNLDVLGAAERAESNIDRCLSAYLFSRQCNLSASYFYLSVAVTPEALAKAERSLVILRARAGPALDEETEAGFALLYLFKRDPERARAQIEYFLETFPSSSRVRDFQSILDNLGPTIEYKEQ